MSRNFLLASYPKSGNTWLRVFLSNLRQDATEPVDINALDDVLGAASQSAFDDAVGIEASDLSDEEVERYRPLVFRYLARIPGATRFLKIHEAYTLLPNGAPLIPADAIIGAIYLVRNPLDVAVSLAHHLNCLPDQAIEQVMSKEFIFPAGVLAGQVRQRLLPWGEHVLSWVDQNAIPVCVVRYEDMKDRPQETFTRIACFLGLSGDPDRVRRALIHSSFDRLQEQERARGFREKHPESASFFRAGKAGGWREVLSPDQMDRIIQGHSAVMRRFGYL